MDLPILTLYMWLCLLSLGEATEKAYHLQEGRAVCEGVQTAGEGPPSAKANG